MLNTVTEIARMAGRTIMPFFGKATPVHYKSDDSPLTMADRAAHECIVSNLTAAFPGIPVLSEESEAEEIADRLSWTRFWLVDPLDGTKEFVKKSGSFTVNIALIDHGKAVLGCIHAPVSGETWWARTGDGAWRAYKNGEPTRVYARSADKNAVRALASVDHLGPLVSRLVRGFPGSKTINMGGSLKFCLVAAGEADVYPRDQPTMEWDTAAGQCILEEAGGHVVDLDGKSLTYNRKNQVNPAFLAFGDRKIDWIGALDG